MMSKKVFKKKGLRAIFFVLLLLILGVIGIRNLGKDKTYIEKDWEGKWNVTYFYENEPDLLYTGTLHLSSEDSLSGQLEVFAPRSNRSELLELSSMSLTKKGQILRGEIRHTRYKIKEGYMLETFTLKLEDLHDFKGRGACVNFCAEGTEGERIIWTGKKPI